jgi:hypothetical protein
MELPYDQDPSDIVWRAEAIAKLIGRRTRDVYHLLETGRLKGARKVGGRWCITRSALFANFEPPPIPVGLRDLAKHLTQDERRAFFGEVAL